MGGARGVCVALYVYARVRLAAQKKAAPSFFEIYHFLRG